MQRLLIILLFVVVPHLNPAPQSGRRIKPTPTAPVQPTLTPEPEPPSAEPLGLPVLPLSLFERQINSLDNGAFRLADFYGKVVVINLWASWCGPCRREVPEYEKVRKTYLGRDVEFIGLTTEDPRTSSQSVKKFLREVEFGFRLGWADREIARTLMNGRNSIPQTLVIGADGRIVDHWSGYSPGQSGNRLKRTIEHVLKG